MVLLYLLTFSSILEFLKNLLIFILVLGVIVGLHEAGHFLFARRAGILCREYAIGMGPKLFGFRKGETFYNLRAFPIGGFCAIAGEEVEEDPFKDVKEVKLEIVEGVIKAFYIDTDSKKFDFPSYEIVSYDIYDEKETGNLYMEVINKSEDGEELTIKYPVDPQAMIYEKKNAMQIAPYNRTLISKTKGQRALVMFGGPLMNFVLAFVVFLIVGFCTLVPNYKSSEISEVAEGTNASEVLLAGDTVKSMRTTTLAKKDISSWNDLQDFMALYQASYLNEKIIIEVERNGEIFEYEVTPFIAINALGIGSDYEYIDNGIAKIAVYQEMNVKKIVDNTSLQIDDVIVSISSKEFPTPILNPTWTEVREVLEKYVGRNDNKEDDYVTLVVKRTDEEGNETEVTVKVLPYSDYVLENQTSLSGAKINPVNVTIGISPTMRFSFFSSIGYAFTHTWTSFTSVLKTFKMLFSGAVSISNLSGPIGIFSITKQASQYGILSVLSLIGLLSVNIGFLNLLPIPALDGGRLVFVAYEAITKKKPNRKLETILITVTFVLLIGLMIFVAYEDILRLFR